MFPILYKPTLPFKALLFNNEYKFKDNKSDKLKFDWIIFDKYLSRYMCSLDTSAHFLLQNIEKLQKLQLYFSFIWFNFLLHIVQLY